MTHPDDADPGTTPTGIRPFTTARMRPHHPVSPVAPAPPPSQRAADPGWPTMVLHHRQPPARFSVPRPRYRHVDPSPYSSSIPGQRAPAGLDPIPAPDSIWADHHDQYRDRARYWWIGALGGVFVLAAISAGAFWLLRDDSSSEQLAGARVSAYGLTYRVPAGWTPRARADLPWARDMLARGISAAPEFDCGGLRRARALSGVLVVYRNDGHPPTPADAASALGRSFAHTIYGADASVAEVEGAGQVTGVGGASVRLAAAPAAGAACPVSGQVDVVALPGADRGPTGQPTLRLFLLQHDTSGGPAAPAPPSTREVGAVLASLRLTASPG